MIVPAGGRRLRHLLPAAVLHLAPTGPGQRRPDRRRQRVAHLPVVVLPNASPALMTLGIFNFVGQLERPAVAVACSRRRPTWARSPRASHCSRAAARGQYGTMMAGSLIAVLPWRSVLPADPARFIGRCDDGAEVERTSDRPLVDRRATALRPGYRRHVRAASGGRDRTIDEYELTEHTTRWCGGLRLVAGSGTKLVRWGVPWYLVEPRTRASWDWRGLDRVVDALLEQGLRRHRRAALRHTAVARGPVRPPRLPAARGRVRPPSPSGSPTGSATTPRSTSPSCTPCSAASTGVWPPYLKGADGFTRIAINLAQGFVTPSARSSTPSAPPPRSCTSTPPWASSGTTRHRSTGSRRPVCATRSTSSKTSSRAASTVTTPCAKSSPRRPGTTPWPGSPLTPCNPTSWA